MAGILDGVRVIDFTWVVAGPQCTQILADFGAEVIRVEWPQRPDGARFRLVADDADRTSQDQSGFWNNLNRNKRSITLNMRHPDAPAIALELIAKSDVVVENFAAGVLESWGLPWKRLQEANPGLVYLSMSGFGSGGPNEKYVVFGPVIQAASGLHTMTARPGSEPRGWGSPTGTTQPAISGPWRSWPRWRAQRHRTGGHDRLQRRGGGGDADVGGIARLPGQRTSVHRLGKRSVRRNGRACRPVSLSR